MSRWTAYFVQQMWAPSLSQGNESKNMIFALGIIFQPKSPRSGIWLLLTFKIDIIPRLEDFKKRKRNPIHEICARFFLGHELTWQIIIQNASKQVMCLLSIRDVVSYEDDPSKLNFHERMFHLESYLSVRQPIKRLGYKPINTHWKKENAWNMSNMLGSLPYTGVNCKRPLHWKKKKRIYGWNVVILKAHLFQEEIVKDRSIH